MGGMWPYVSVPMYVGCSFHRQPAVIPVCACVANCTCCFLVKHWSTPSLTVAVNTSLLPPAVKTALIVD